MVPAPRSEASRALPWLVPLFVASGAAALVYEVVWFQMLRLVIGATAVSLGVLLASFMGGMFLGSLILPRLVSRHANPLRVYASLEAGIAVLGLVLLVAIPAVAGVYVDLAVDGRSAMVVRALVCSALLLPPTALMGATLPAVARLVRAEPSGIAWMGWFYTGNIGGAAVGSLLAGFWVLPRYDVVVATGLAVGLNVIASAGAWVLSRRDLEVRSDQPEGSGAPAHGAETGAARVRWVGAVYGVVFLSGLVALGAQVVWTRLLSLLLGATTYTFSLILAVFLVGLGAGSGIGSRLAARVRRPARALAVAQLLAAVSLVYAAWLVNRVVPHLSLPDPGSARAWLLLGVDLGRCALAILPGPLCWGATFPLSVAAASRAHEEDGGWLVGRVYAANTAGAILGALAVAVVLTPALGTQATQQSLVAASVVAALLALGAQGLRGSGAVGKPAVALAALLAVLPALVPPTNERIITHGRQAGDEAEGRTLYVGEGLNASLAVTEHEDSVRSFRISGKIAASTWPEDMVLQRMLGHYSALFHDDPKTVLVVGFGAGVTAGTFLAHPSVERVVICEIESLATDVAGHYFEDANHAVLTDPRVEVINDDARHYLLTTTETFDVITSDPIHPWVEGAASLYTVEYFELARDHLAPGGVISQWVPLYESTLDVVRTEIATFAEVFPEATAWSTHHLSPGWDLVLAARPDGLQIDADRLDERLTSPSHMRALASLREVGITSADDVLVAFAGRAPELTPFFGGASLNRDRNLRLMYLAGMGINADEAAAIHEEIFRHRSFPDRLIVASPQRLERIRTSIVGGIM